MKEVDEYTNAAREAEDLLFEILASHATFFDRCVARAVAQRLRAAREVLERLSRKDG